MSWQGYVDEQLKGSGKIKDAAILAIDNSGVWGISSGYKSTFTATEQEEIRKTIKSEEFSGVRAKGIHAGGKKFMCTRADGRSMYGTKKTDSGAVIGVVVVKTKQAILVAEYEPPIQAGEATPVVESLADYLIGAGY